MTQRQAALFGGLAALLVIIAVAATMSVVARRSDEAQATSTPAISDARPVATSTVIATATTSTATTSPAIGAHAFMAGDIASGAVAASRKSTDVWPLASLTKLMTATIAVRELPPDEPVTIVEVPGGNPSRPVLPTGETLAMKDVLSVMLVASSNEAAESLAARVGRERFIQLMNEQAAAWGLTHTTYADASGLSAANKSTAREVFEIAQHVWNEHPEVFQTTRKPSVTVYAQGTGVAYTAYATHELVRDPGFLGGKTGYTEEAQGNLLSIFQIGQRVEALVVLGSDDRFGDTRRLKATLKNP